MRISLSEIKKYVQVPEAVSDQDLVELIGSRLVEIEEVIDLAPKYREAYIVRVETCEPIPETHLHLCQVNAGDKRLELQGENGLIQVVCGAPNVRVGMLAVWLAPGAIVPATFGGENFQLGSKQLRGHISNGMLAALDELDLGDDHEGIIAIDPTMAQPGAIFADVFGLNDVILDVENKSLTHRPDCFGLIGFAREIAGILGVKFSEPKVFASITSIVAQNVKNVNSGIANSAQPVGNSAKIDVKITDFTLCPRYSCAIFDLPEAQPSPFLTPAAIFLAKAGMRTIDPMVDLTNILMLETGQPLHAFDYDKLLQVGGQSTARVIVRAAQDGETLQLLDGKTITCTPDDILIASNNIPVALAGAMGGQNTAIDASTRRVVLESATFSLYNLRKTQMAHGIFSEAITRFTKGQPAAITLPVLQEAIDRLGVEPLALADDYPVPSEQVVVKITTDAINGLLGTEYSTEQIRETLENVGFGVKAIPEQAHSLTVTAPAWRTDIHLKEDIIEEVGRLLGYDNIALTLPVKPFLEPEIDPIVKLKRELREILSGRLAMNELLTYSFVHRDLLTKAGQDPDDCYQIVNSISPDLQYFRPALVPSLLDKAHENLKAGHRAFTLYELNQISRKSAGLTPEGTPVARTHLGIVDVNDFYALKAKILALFRKLKIPVDVAALSPEAAREYPALEPKRSAAIKVNDVLVGAFGELKNSTVRQFKFETTIAAGEIDLEPLVAAPRVLQASVQLSKFPSVERDFTFQVAADTPFAQIATALEQSLAQQELLYYTITPVSVYQPAGAAIKNLSFHVKFASFEQTLTAADISAIIDKISQAATTIGAKII